MGETGTSLGFGEAARCLAELGHPVRLRIFDYLVKAGDDGCPVGEIQAHLNIPKSTLSHHLGQLAMIGLLTQSREGRVLRCRVDRDRMRLVQGFINTCCEGR